MAREGACHGRSCRPVPCSVKCPFWRGPERGPDPRMASTAPPESPDLEKERHESDLYTRPGWVDAAVALDQLDQVRTIARRAGPRSGLGRTPAGDGGGAEAPAPPESGVIDDLGQT